MAAFYTPIEAIKWCFLVQEALLVAEWSETLLTKSSCNKVVSADGRILFQGPRVRMGIHSGPVEIKVHPTTGFIEYEK